MHGQRTVLFIDEIHRFNKAQQDAILPHVEDGTVILIGATTENPSFEVNSPLLSRSRVIVLHALDRRRHPHDRSSARWTTPSAGSAASELTIDDDALDFLVNLANGDARFALNTLEYAATGAGCRRPAARSPLSWSRRPRNGAPRPTTRAAKITSTRSPHCTRRLRGSDPDAALYWLARMLERGDDPLYVARRLVRFASEDVGLADPQALQIAMAAQQAVHFIGLPEGALALAELVVYLALAPKSNAIYRAYGEAVAAT